MNEGERKWFCWERKTSRNALFYRILESSPLICWRFWKGTKSGAPGTDFGLTRAHVSVDQQYFEQDNPIKKWPQGFLGQFAVKLLIIAIRPPFTGNKSAIHA